MEFHLVGTALGDLVANDCRGHVFKGQRVDEHGFKAVVADEICVGGVRGRGWGVGAV